MTIEERTCMIATSEPQRFKAVLKALGVRFLVDDDQVAPDSQCGLFRLWYPLEFAQQIRNMVETQAVGLVSLNPRPATEGGILADTFLGHFTPSAAALVAACLRHIPGWASRPANESVTAEVEAFRMLLVNSIGPQEYNRLVESMAG